MEELCAVNKSKRNNKQMSASTMHKRKSQSGPHNIEIRVKAAVDCMDDSNPVGVGSDRAV